MQSIRSRLRAAWRGGALAAFALAAAFTPPASAAEVNAYSIWPENWARPMFEEFEKATGIKVNFVRFSSGEALARVIAEKNNPRVDVLFGGPVETFAAGVSEGVFEPYKPPTFGKLPPRFRHADGQWVAIADDPLVFMTNQKFLAEHKLKRLQIVSPLNGVVSDVTAQKGAWVMAGDPVATVTRMDQLRIDIRLDSTEYNPSDLVGRKMTIILPLAENETI